MSRCNPGLNVCDCVCFLNDTATTEIYTTDTLLPYTTLFRSVRHHARLRQSVQRLCLAHAGARRLALYEHHVVGQPAAVSADLCMAAGYRRSAASLVAGSTRRNRWLFAVAHRRRRPLGAGHA